MGVLNFIYVKLCSHQSHAVQDCYKGVISSQLPFRNLSYERNEQFLILELQNSIPQLAVAATAHS